MERRHGKVQDIEKLKMDHVKIAKEALDLAKEIYSLPDAYEILNKKNEKDYATNADIGIEKLILAYLHQTTPSYGVISEETAPSANFKHYTWVLDPIDGTINFARRHPLYALSIALIKDSEAVVSCIYLPSFQKLYVAERGNGAELNGSRLSVSETNTLAKSIVAVGDFATGPGSQEKNRLRASITTALGDKSLRVRMHGSAAVDHCFLAEGCIDASVILSNKAWDIQPGVLMVREAGGSVVDFNGARHSPSSRYTIASNSLVQSELVQLVEVLVGGQIWSANFP